jgi:hypothetical protein
VLLKGCANLSTSMTTRTREGLTMIVPVSRLWLALVEGNLADC